jgi:hypothetical protein
MTPTTVDFLMLRYKDAYRTARILEVVGLVVKVLSAVVAAVFIIGGMVWADKGGGLLGAGVGLVTSCIFGIVGFALGMIVSAQGQIVRATLDIAVNTSRHPGADQAARVVFQETP